MRVLIADEFNEDCLEQLVETQAEVIYRPELDGETLAEALAHSRPDVLIVRETQVGDIILDATPYLSLIIRTGDHTDNINVPLASQLGIGVADARPVGEAKGETADERAVCIANTYQCCGRIVQCLNLQKSQMAEKMILVRHLDQPGVLAQVFSILSKANINVNETENLVFDGGRAACAHIRVEGPLTDAVMKQISRCHDALIAVSVMDLPDEDEEA